MRILEAWGRMAGGIIAPVVALGSLTRNARLFHPTGVVYWATVHALVDGGPFGELAKRLEGPALVRLSNAIWRSDREWPDVLGVAIRFLDSKNADVRHPASCDQDLLFATIRRTATLPFAPFSTNTRDFLRNEYRALLPFFVSGLGRVEFRLVPMRVPAVSGTRCDKLLTHIADGAAVFQIEMRRKKWGARWKHVALIDIQEKAQVDQNALAFHPFRSGRGIFPIGALQMIRAAVYKASLVGRTLTKP